MRFALSALSLAMVAASAHAQQTPTSKTSDPVYFLIDASGSMARGANWGDVVDQVARRVAKIQKTNIAADISINLIAGDTRNCDTPIDLVQPAPLAELILGAPKQDGSTLVGLALKEAIEAVENKPTGIVLVTDGSEQCGPSICEISESLLPNRRHINVELMFTEDTSPLDKARLSCVAHAQGRPTSLAALQAQNEPENDGGNTPWPLTPIYLVLLVGSVIGAAMALAFHLGRKASLLEHELDNISKASNDAEKQKKLLEDWNKVKHDKEKRKELGSPTTKLEWEKNLSVPSLVMAAFGALALFLLGWLLCAGDIEKLSVWDALNAASIAYGIPAILLAMAGFTGLQVWRYGEGRRQLYTRLGEYSEAKELGQLRQYEEDYRINNRMRAALRRQNLELSSEHNLPDDISNILITIKVRLIELALGKPVDMKDALSDSKRLEGYRFKRGWSLRSAWTLEEFAQLLASDKLIDDRVPELVRNAETATIQRRYDKVREAILDMHSSLEPPAANAQA
ncbi:MAG: VWA domain-containing protein [Chitinophagaceae bacterium]|nr:MAG: VWA domain-containing protein [Chitinophagaceae bacterium]